MDPVQKMSPDSHKRRRVPVEPRRMMGPSVTTALLLCLLCLSLTATATGSLEVPSTTTSTGTITPPAKKVHDVQPPSPDGSSSTENDRDNDVEARKLAAAVPPRSRYSGESPPRPGTKPLPPSITPVVQQQHTQQQPHENKYPSPVPSDLQEKYENEFMEWCEQVLGIYTILEIQTFEYYDYMQALPTNTDDDEYGDYDDDDDDDDVDRLTVAVENLPMVPVRGLAASRDIAEGEVVIRIPLQALLTVQTTIDQDPVLSRVMGPQARKDHGWASSSGTSMDTDTTDTTEDEGDYFLEMPLLAVALLHHKKLGAASPMSAYIQMLESSPVDHMPFLWSTDKLKSQAGHGIRTVARGIQQEFREMYDSIVQVLIREHPDLFGRPLTTGTASATGSTLGINANASSNEKKWMFSFESFQWAMAMVNSRHWQLPISDLESPEASVGGGIKEHSKPRVATTTDEQVPPADMPTDIWTQEHDGDVDDQDNVKENTAVKSHSFLAPVADLLNFGPPCTTGRYNTESHTFEIVASCPFTMGQEVTFWYSDECDDIMAGSYGFTHPMVPKCPTREDLRNTSEELKERTVVLEEQLREAYEDLNHLYAELEHAQEILNGCDCCRYEKRTGDASNNRREEAADEPSYRLRHEPSVRGSKTPSTSNEDIGRHGVRRMWRDRQPEF